jgi:hypothetical protein
MLALIALLLHSQFTEMRDVSGLDYANVTGETEKRFIVSSLGTGVALFDYDQDGDLDLYFANGARLEGREIRGYGEPRLYRNEGGFQLVDVTRQSGLFRESFSQGCAVGDADNDGFPDLYVTGIGANVFYRNRGDGTFVEITETTGTSSESWGTSAAFFDADSDSDLDLYVANYADPDVEKLPLPGDGPSCRWLAVPVFCGPTGLAGAKDVYFENEGNGRFTDRTQDSGLSDGIAAYGLGVVTGDYDSDGDLDLYVSNDSVPNFLFQNDGRGNFVETALFAGVAYNTDGLAQAGMGVDFGDLDSDSHLDVFVTNFSHDTNTAYRNLGNGVFEDATTELNLRMPSWFYLAWATRFVDLDNDGDEDLFIANGHVYPEAGSADAQTSYAQRNQIFWNLGSGKFEEGAFAPGDAMEEIYSTRGGAFGDLDDDGYVDVALVNIDDEASLLRNDGGENRWIGLRLVGRASNRDAIGARVFTTSGSLRQMKEVHPSGSYLSSNDPRLLFGLGTGSRVEELTIRWPSGAEQVLSDLEAGRYHLIVEPPGTSSPSRE